MKRQSCRWIVPFVLAALGLAEQASGQGIVVPGVGPVNRSMGSAGVAAPLDAAGAMHWNPASLTGMKSSEFVIGGELLYLSTHLGSTVEANALGPGAPPVTLSGETRSHSGVSILPTVAVVFQPDDSRWTFGLGMFSIGGFGMNLPASSTAAPENPILSPAFGGGPAYSKLAVLQLAPSAALQLTERLSIGFAPTFDIAEAALDPNPFASPLLGPPEATHTRTIWGLGFQAGIYYEHENGWHLGASYKSPQWFEEPTFYGTTITDEPRTDSFSVTCPAIISLGAAYSGLPRTVWAVDLRYLDYSNTRLFGDDAGYTLDGAWTGLGWESVFSLATGLQYQLTDALSLRVGYCYCDNPIPDENTFFNIASTAIYQHIVSVGASWNISCRTSLVLAYLKAFENSISGPWVVPPGVPVPGTSVTARQTIDCLVAGLQVKF
ncbi:MAG: hypothetical protein GX575_26715 [Candidatus Anammoximicrobium sp.]|nr:hypothetical protein [Candidatus Anammoximicrobium sp.]